MNNHGMPWRFFSKVLLNASCHKKHENNWFMGMDLSSFQDTKPFYEVKEVEACVGPPGDFLINIIQLFHACL